MHNSTTLTRLPQTPKRLSPTIHVRLPQAIDTTSAEIPLLLPAPEKSPRFLRLHKKLLKKEKQAGQDLPSPKSVSPPSPIPVARSRSLRLRPLIKPKEVTLAPSVLQWQLRCEDREQRALIRSIRELNGMLEALRIRSKSSVKERNSGKVRRKLR